jgi:hypothetical protein
MGTSFVFTGLATTPGGIAQYGIGAGAIDIVCFW